jgi:predicted phosphodiesterase
MRSAIAAVLIIGSAVLAGGEEKLAGGPYVVNVGPRSATIAYVVQTGEVKVRNEQGEVKTVPVLRRDQVSMASLRPGTRYEYNTAGGLQGSFRTPPNGRGDFEFVVFGDTRTRDEVHRRAVAAIVDKTEPDFVIHTGDLVANGLDTALWPVFFDIEGALLRKTAFFPVLGNHERNDPQYHEFFESGPGYYSFNWGGAHFAALNSDVANASPVESIREAYWAEQVKWLEADLAKNQKADFRFVISHHPPLTAVGRRQGGNQHMKALIPILEKYGTSAIFNGHDHNYQHHLMNGVHYVVTGGGGAPLYEVDKPIPGVTLKVEQTENFVRVRVRGTVAQVTAFGLDGRVLDEFEVGTANPEQAKPSKTGN